MACLFGLTNMDFAWVFMFEFSLFTRFSNRSKLDPTDSEKTQGMIRFAMKIRCIFTTTALQCIVKGKVIPRQTKLVIRKEKINQKVKKQLRKEVYLLTHTLLCCKKINASFISGNDVIVLV